ncbi:MAG: hypothetical protein AAF902_08375 [Chloroflexota bacterium]
MLFEQALRLVSQSPENFAYHLIVFLCLQLVFVLSAWLNQKSPQDKLAYRLMYVSGGMVLARLAWAAALFFFADIRVDLAPVERGMSLLSIGLLTWAITPAWEEVAWLRGIGLGLVTVGSIAGSYYGYLDWIGRKGVEQYANTAQAPAWALVGLILTFGCILTLSAMRPFDWILRIATILPIIAGLTLHLFAVNPAQFSSVELASELSSGIVPVWDRFAWLITLPLLVAVAYRRLMSYLLSQSTDSAKGRTRVATMLEQSVHLMESEGVIERVIRAGELFDDMYGVQFVGVAMLASDDMQYADLTIMQKDKNGLVFEDPRRWMLNLSDWPFILQALDHNTAIEVSPYDQKMTRKAYELHQELHLRFVTPVLVVPLVRGESKLGFLFLGAVPQQTKWSDENKEILNKLSDHIARSFLDREKISRLQFAEQGLGIVNDLEITAKVDALEEENKLLKSRLTDLKDSHKETQRELRIVRKVAEDREKESSTTTETDALKQEVSVLRDALMEAEISLDRTTVSGMGGTDTVISDLEKYAKTISGYSGQLDVSKERVRQLEYKVNQILSGSEQSGFASPIEEIRTPLAMIAAYTDLLLVDTTGFMSVKQIDLLQRVKLSTERVADMVDELETNIRDQLGVLVSSEVDEVFTQAVTALGEQLENRNIKLRLDMDDEFPKIRLGEHILINIFSQVMELIASKMRNDGVIRVSLQSGLPTVDKLQEAVATEEPLLIFVAETDDLDEPEKRKNGLLLDSVVQLKQTIRGYGGRMWSDGTDRGTGYRTVVLLPALHGSNNAQASSEPVETAQINEEEPEAIGK